MNTSAIPAIIRVDFARKLFALALATVIWYTVRFEILTLQSFHQVPLKLEYDSSKVFIQEDPPAVTLTFRGAKSKLDAIDPSDLSVTIRIPDPEPGVYEYEAPLSGRRTIKAPRGTRLLSATPARIVLKVDRIISKSLPVKVEESGKLAPNYQILSRAAVPPAVQVRGPSRSVEALAFVRTQPISLDHSVTDSFHMKEVELLDVPNLSMSPSVVSVSYEIARDDDHRKFENIAIRVLNSVPPKLHVSSDIPSVTAILRGPKAQLDALAPTDVHPFVDISSHTKPGRSKFRVSIRVDSPVQFTTEALTPPTVSIDLVPAPEASIEGIEGPPTIPKGPGKTGDDAAVPAPEPQKPG